MLESIKIEPLERLLSKKLGYEIHLVKSVWERRGKEYLEFCSQDMADCTGIMSSQYKRFVVSNFGGSMTSNGAYWCQVAFSFEYKNGGSNGHCFMDVFYDFEKEVWYERP